MALFCFWFRRACSHYAALGESVPPNSSLDAHIHVCAECRAYCQEISRLTADLDRLIAAPRPSAQYLEPIWERVRPTPRPPQWSRLSLAGAAACGLACGWLAWQVAGRHVTPKSPEVAVSGVDKAPDEEPRKATALELPDPKYPTTLAQRDADAVPARHSLVFERPSLRGRRFRTRLAARRRSDVPPTAALPAAGAGKWRAQGLMFESSGDPGLANVAYQSAYEHDPTEDAAFDVGRSAEESGDMEQALDVYAKLLESADAKSRNQKGWTP
jgi:hypothetical protein